MKQVKNSKNGEKRFVFHFLEILSEEEQNSIKPSINKVSELYNIAAERAKKIGGEKYFGKDYGGGIVITAENEKQAILKRDSLIINKMSQMKTKADNQLLYSIIDKRNGHYVHAFEVESVEGLMNIVDSIYQENNTDFSGSQILEFLESAEVHSLSDDKEIEEKILNFSFREYMYNNYLTVNAEADPHKEIQKNFFRGDLSAECPFCEDINGYVSTGGHPTEGSDVVTCNQCGKTFWIYWNIKGN